ncbi:MAG: hypothetical protein ACRDHL_00040, partial [Candidatus Promineifilaceae bacterium]
YALYRYLLAGRGHRPRRRWLGLWLAASLAGSYTHYFGFFIFACGLLCLAVAWIALGRGPGLRRPLLVGLALGLALLLPLIPAAAARFLAGRQVDFDYVPPAAIAEHAAGAFSVGMHPALIQPAERVLPVVLLALMGVWSGWRGRRPATLLLLAYQFVPLGLLALLSTVNPLYNGTRHLLIGLPPFLIFVALGIAAPFRPTKRAPPGRAWAVLAGGLALFLVASQTAWLRTQFDAPELVRDDVRGAAEVIGRLAGPADLVVLHDSLIQFAFNYYYRGAAPVIPVPSFGQLSSQGAILALQAAAEGKRLVWLLAEPRPRNGASEQALTDWANRHWSRLSHQQFAAMWLPVSLSAYAPPPAAAGLPEDATPADPAWQAEGLLGYQELFATSGRDWTLPVYLAPRPAPAGALTLSFRLVDASGTPQVVADRPLYPDEAAAGPAGEPARRFLRIAIPAGVPPGRYQVWLRLLAGPAGAAVALSDGQPELVAGEVELAPTACDAPLAPGAGFVPERRAFGHGLELRGYSLPAGQVRPGIAIPVELWWCTRRPAPAGYGYQLEALAAGGAPAAEAGGSLGPPAYPSSDWQAGQLIRSRLTLALPPETASGSYAFRLSLLAGDAGRALGPSPLALGALAVETWPLLTELPAIQHPLRADFGRPALVELHGWALEPAAACAGQEAALTLVWRSAAARIGANYNVFVHLTNPAGAIVAQGDSLPAGAGRPTLTWRQGEVILDEHRLRLPAEPGAYRLWVGLHDLATGGRAPLAGEGEAAAGDRLLLQALAVAGCG